MEIIKNEQEAPMGAWLERIRTARRHADEWFSSCDLKHGTPGSAMALLWQGLFDYLCVASAKDLEELEKLTDILKKLMGSYAQLRTVELRERNQAWKEESRALKQALSAMGGTASAPGLIKTIEDALELM